MPHLRHWPSRVCEDCRHIAPNAGPRVLQSHFLPHPLLCWQVTGTVSTQNNMKISDIRVGYVHFNFDMSEMKWLIHRDRVSHNAHSAGGCFGSRNIRIAAWIWNLHITNKIGNVLPWLADLQATPLGWNGTRTPEAIAVRPAVAVTATNITSGNKCRKLISVS